MKVIIIVFKIYYLDYQCFIVINHNIGLKFFLLLGIFLDWMKKVIYFLIIGVNKVFITIKKKIYKFGIDIFKRVLMTI